MNTSHEDHMIIKKLCFFMLLLPLSYPFTASGDWNWDQSSVEFSSSIYNKFPTALVTEYGELFVTWNEFNNLSGSFAGYNLKGSLLRAPDPGKPVKLGALDTNPYDYPTPRLTSNDSQEAAICSQGNGISINQYGSWLPRIDMNCSYRATITSKDGGLIYLFANAQTVTSTDYTNGTWSNYNTTPLFPFNWSTGAPILSTSKEKYNTLSVVVTAGSSSGGIAVAQRINNIWLTPVKLEKSTISGISSNSISGLPLKFGPKTITTKHGESLVLWQNSFNTADGIVVKAICTTINNGTISDNHIFPFSGSYALQINNKNDIIAAGMGTAGVPVFSTYAGNKWSNPLGFVPTGSIYANEWSTSQIALDGSGGITIAWFETPPCQSPMCDTNTYLKARRYYNGVWTETTTIDVNLKGFKSLAIAASPETDDTYILWERFDGSGLGGKVLYRHGGSKPTFPLSLSVNGNGTVFTEPGNSSCGTQCTNKYEIGTMVTLTPTAQPGSIFSSWGGDCTGTNPCSLTIDSPKSVTAVFLPTYSLSVTKNASGNITSTPGGINCGQTCTASFASGAQVSLTQTANEGYEFANWTGACSGSGACLINMDSNKSVGAVFNIAPVKHKLTVSKTGSGTITSIPESISCGPTCNATFTAGTTVTLIAQPDYGYAFSTWAGDCSSTGTCAVTMDNDKSVAATFIELTKYQVAVQKPSTGLVVSEPAGISCGGSSKACKASFSSAKLTATPNPGYEFTKWIGCQSAEGNSCFLKLTSKASVKPIFKKIPKFNIKITKNKLGSIVSSPELLKCKNTAVSCNVKFDKGTVVTLTPTPIAGREFTGWTGDCSGIDSCVLEVDANKKAVANFQ